MGILTDLSMCARLPDSMFINYLEETFLHSAGCVLYVDMARVARSRLLILHNRNKTIKLMNKLIIYH